jgi:hypothetical protein
MQQFERMVEAIRTKGILTGSHKLWIPDQQSVIWEYLEKSQPFVLSPAVIDHKLNSIPNDGRTLKLDKVNIEAPPFPSLSIEAADGRGLCTAHLEGMGTIRPICIQIAEFSPGAYFNLWLCDEDRFGDVVLNFQPGASAIANMTNALIDTINNNRTGYEVVRKTIKIGVGSEKRNRRIRRVIYISPKKIKEDSSLSGRNIEWTHRFLVRGHWRKIDTIGKNRDGEYVVPGYTWVSHHTRGDESLPLVKKIRLVKNDDHLGER